MTKVETKDSGIACTNDWKFFAKLLATISLWFATAVLVVCGFLWVISFGVSCECAKPDLGVFGPIGVITIAGLILKFGNPFRMER